MIVWHRGGLPEGGEPILWQVRLDDPEVERLAGRARLQAADWQDLAGRPQAEMRGMRRQLTRVLLAHVAGCHPDSIVFERSTAGALSVVEPAGWFVSVAGRWPHALIGLSRAPLGVDIEPADAAPPPPDALTPGEREDLARAPDLVRLCRWTAKEAHAKLLGNAAQADPAEIHTQAEGDVLRVSSPAGQTVCHLDIGAEVICTVAFQP